MTIRIFENNDLANCIRLFINVFNREPWNDQWTQERAEQYLIDYIRAPGFIGIVCEQDDQINGFIFGARKRWWKGDEFFVNEMCVDHEIQRTGIGTSMIEYLEQELQNRGIDSVALLTNRGIPAEGFYKKNGFAEVKRLVFLAKKL